jgi:D-sedoheptulose 7-phosphate isomerase
MQKEILSSVEEVIRAAETLKTSQALTFIERSSRMIADVFSSGHKIIVAGNGGSLCDAIHFAEEFTGQFRRPRKGLPAIALADPGHLTCVGNDMGFTSVFSRGVEALGSEGDLFVGLTTSGNSENIIQAVMAAKIKKMKTIAFLGKAGGKMKGLCDLEWIVSGFPFADRVQEAHMAAMHVIIQQVETLLLLNQNAQFSSLAGAEVH